VHAPQVQTPVTQSASTLHLPPTGHGAQGPPQSTSVSPWFRVLSLHVGPRQKCDVASQMALGQSAAPLQGIDRAQRMPLGPLR
jgi:hypothetical protein